VAKSHVTRRQVLGAGAVGAVAAGIPAAAEAKRARHRVRTRRADVVIVGAGIAGLTAARALRRKGRSVIVMEARERVGGRTWSKNVGHGEVADLGAAFVGPTQDHVLALIKSLGIKTFPTYNEGSNVQFLNGVRTLYPADGLPPDPGVTQDLGALLALDGLAAQVGVEAPWSSPRAAEFDSQTLESWAQANLKTASGKKVFETAVQPNWGAEPRDLSLLYVLFYIAAAGNEKNPGSLVRLITTPGGAQESRLEGGTQLISIRMAKALGRKRVELGVPVKSIRQHNGRVTVEADGLVVHARRAIVAIPPTLTAEIEYHPKLPSKRAQLIQRIPQGTLVKAEAIYDKAFWRDENLSGQAVADVGPARTTFDASPRSGTPGVMLGFVGGHDARTWSERSAAARRQAVLKNLADYYGAAALKPKKYFEQDWSQEVWTRGCPVGYTAPGVLYEYGPALRRPVGRVHWAGTETSTYWIGYMDGAVRSGERAAREVLRA
jgi:monoamine oxidase